MQLLDTTSTILGATPVAIHPPNVWIKDGVLSDDGLRVYLHTRVGAVRYLILDIENPALMELNILRAGVTVDDVKRGVETALHLLNVCRQERPDLKVAFYDSDLEDYTTIAEAMEATIRKYRPRGDGYDAYYTEANVKNKDVFGRLASLEAANDLIRDVHRAEGFSLRRAYFPYSAKEAWKREGLIRYQWRAAVRQANGVKDAALLYWPARYDSGGTRRVYLSAGDVAADLAVMSDEGVTHLITWKDQTTPASVMTRVAESMKAQAEPIGAA
jgi:hypothetical protein